MKNLLLLLYLSVTGLNYAQTNYFVSVNGDNGNEGSIHRPWKTIQFGINQLFAGDTLSITEGTYNEKLALINSGTKEQKIVIRNSLGNVVVDATGITSQNAIMEIMNQSFITVYGLELSNNIQNNAQGILIEGNCVGITIENCRIKDIHFSNKAREKPTAKKNAHGIIVYGNNSTYPIRELLLRNNEIYDCRLGYSEGIALNGNIDGFMIEGNKVHDLTNIGIDLIGHEGTADDPEKDQARNGIVRKNEVFNCNSKVATAAGIYVDGGRDIVIEENISYNNGYGIEIGCENKGKTSDNIKVISNKLYKNEVSGLAVGGYDYPKTGKVVNSSFINNLFYCNSFKSNGIAELFISYLEKGTIKKNYFYLTKDNKAIFSVFKSNDVVIDQNSYYTKAGQEAIKFVFNSKYYVGLTELKSGSNFEGNAIFLDSKSADKLLNFIKEQP